MFGKKKNKEFDESMQTVETSNAEKLKQEAKKRKEKEKFITIRMWLSVFISKFFNDRGTIPKNIGNNVLVTNNQYVTKNHLSAVIRVFEMSEYTPVMWMSELPRIVKDQVEGVVVDITVKCQPYYVDTSESGMASRIRTWKMTLDNPLMPVDNVRRAARCLYSYDVAKSGQKLYKGRTFITVRALDSAKLKKGVNAACEYLSSIGAIFKKIESNMQENLEYMSLLSDKNPPHLKDYPAVIYTIQTIAESLPGIQGMNNTRGVLFGYDIIAKYAYLIDFKSTSNAKNVMIEANSGFGKTFMAEFWLYPFFADGFNLCIMDIKGTEFDAITKALHGHSLSMRNDSTYYINSWVWHTDEVYDGDYHTYANERFRLSKEKMLIMASLNEDEASSGETLLESFLKYVYESIGARIDNVNTWSRTEVLNPYVIFDMFERYLSHELYDRYPVVAKKTLERLRVYMSREGSSSHMFRNELSYAQLLDNKVLRFDFGILEESSDQDPVMFRLHVLDMTIVNDAFVSHKKAHSEWTAKVLEESQVVDDYLTRIYTREITLRRAQNQVTILLGNSIAALAANPLSRPMLENINILVLGAITKSSRDYLREEYGLSELHEEMLEDVQTNSELDHTFLLINRMEKNATTALLRASVPDDVRDGSLFRVVDTVTE